MTNKNCCCQTCGEEFQLNKFRLELESSDCFYKSQWQNSSKSIWWFLYRVCLALCFVLGVFGSMIYGFNGGKWFIYLTNWGFFLCMFTCVFGAVLVGLYYFKSSLIENDVKGWVLKFYWASHFSTAVMALLITLVYWSFLYPAYEDPSPSGGFNLWAHLFNSVLMVTDQMLVAFPTRLLHFVYPFIVGFTYMFFSVIYYLAGGTDVHGNHFIYPILDWSQPGPACITVVGCVVLVLTFCTILFLLYRLRVLISNKLTKPYHINNV